MEDTTTTTTTTTTSQGQVSDRDNTKSFSIKITTITGTTFNIHAQKSDTVQQLKDRIFNTIHIVPELQRLTFQDKVLDFGLLEEYGLEEGSTVSLSPVLKAGTASSTKRSLNIDQKSVSELIRSLPQEQLAILLNQKKPVTVTAKMGDHVVVFTLVPSDSNDSCHESSPSSPLNETSSLVSSSPSPSPFVTTSSSSSSSSSSSRYMRRREHLQQQQQLQEQSLNELVPIPEGEVNLSDRVELIKRRLSFKRVLDEMERQKMEQETTSSRSKKHRRHHHHHHHSSSGQKVSSSSSRRLKHSSRGHRSSRVEETINTPLQQEQQQEQTQMLTSSSSYSPVPTSPAPSTSEIKMIEESHSMETSNTLTCPTQVSLVSSNDDTTISTCSSSTSLSTSPSSEEAATNSLTLKCSKCCKKLKPMKSYTCKCGHLFCIDHRHQNINSNSEKGHNCTFDFKALGREELRASNPLIQGPKIQHI